MKIEKESAHEFALVFQGNDEDEALFGETSKRPKAAYYKNFERKINLKKKRVNKYETSYSDKWDGILLSHTPFLQEELDERDELEAEVKDPTFVLRAAEEQADEAEENPDVTMESPKQEVSELQVADS